MLDKPCTFDSSPALRDARGRVRLPAKILLSLTEAVRDRLKAEADSTHSTIATVARRRILQTFAEDDQRMGKHRPVEPARPDDEARAA